jgi:hypothetical protein
MALGFMGQNQCTTWDMKHLVAQFGLALTFSCLGLGLIYLAIIDR